MKKIVLIPSRLESKRLPGKALLDVDGLPIIVHTAKRSSLAKNVDEVYVCTDSDKIISACKEHSIKCIKTKSDFLNGTERIASVCDEFSNSLIIDVQGDEPLIRPEYIDSLIEAHLNHSNSPEIIIPTIEVPYSSSDTIVRVVSSVSGRVMTLTRGNAPYRYKSEVSLVKKHVSVISFTSDALVKYSKLPVSYLENIEDIELLRAVENDMNVYTHKLDGNSFSVDVNDDYLKAKVAMIGDPIRKLY
tara:strand:+ start:28767 stop:29504 length:738 start_codon:yes stop_codon:yes gene_type:complete